MLDLHAQTLARAAHIVGGTDILSAELGVQPDLLDRYLRGEAVVPSELFLRASEIVTAASVLEAAKANQESSPQAK
ncbi:MAG TPA: hypothetical protein VH600_13530 [Burkholderiales bacterium]